MHLRHVFYMCKSRIRAWVFKEWSPDKGQHHLDTSQK